MSRARRKAIARLAGMVTTGSRSPSKAAASAGSFPSAPRRKRRDEPGTASEAVGAVRLAALAAIAGRGLAGRLPGARPKPPSIVMVTIDTLRADRMGSYGYFRDTSPNLDRFGAENLFFANAVTTMATTPARSCIAVLVALSASDWRDRQRQAV